MTIGFPVKFTVMVALSRVTVPTPFPAVADLLSDAEPEALSEVSGVPREDPFWVRAIGNPAKAPSLPLSEFPLESWVIPPLRMMLDPVAGVVVLSDAVTSA